MAKSEYVIIVGCGRLGVLIAEHLSRAGRSVVVVDADETSFEELSASFGGFTLVGDAVEPSVLLRAGIDQADHLIATTDKDNVNLMVAQVAQRIYNVPNVVARVFDPARHALYRAFSIATICPTELSALALLRLVGVAIEQEGDACGSLS